MPNIKIGDIIIVLTVLFLLIATDFLLFGQIGFKYTKSIVKKSFMLLNKLNPRKNLDDIQVDFCDAIALTVTQIVIGGAYLVIYYLFVGKVNQNSNLQISYVITTLSFLLTCLLYARIIYKYKEQNYKYINYYEILLFGLPSTFLAHQVYIAEDLYLILPLLLLLLLVNLLLIVSGPRTEIGPKKRQDNDDLYVY